MQLGIPMHSKGYTVKVGTFRIITHTHSVTHSYCFMCFVDIRVGCNFFFHCSVHRDHKF